MITQRATELSIKVHQGLNPFQDLHIELTQNCTPTLEEFLKLAGDLVYQPESYYTIYWIVDAEGDIKLSNLFLKS